MGYRHPYPAHPAIHADHRTAGPLRRRVQALFDRRFYRKKYDAAQVLTAFALTARDETDLDSLTAALSRVVDETIQPVGVTIWLKP
ncbi:MAG: hypothetical protein KJZ86_06530 [Caldilineaceae bacterium]|nr:hypothetical protein [Caldilineaceae bacterium]HRJ44163.1 hypothetical protein [Caldilineaceae bacterium]